jgi:hypothetical protein
MLSSNQGMIIAGHTNKTSTRSSTCTPGKAVATLHKFAFDTILHIQPACHKPIKAEMHATQASVVGMQRTILQQAHSYQWT